MKHPHLWLRAECKPHEERRALSPGNAGKLVAHGFRVRVERSSQSIFEAWEYEKAGCEIADSESWEQLAPPDTFILGLKELPPSPLPLTHHHIYFAHAYKGQAGWQDVLRRFHDGGGSLLDLEYLTDESGRRVAAFGFWAGFAGAAVALQAWQSQQSGKTLRKLEGALLLGQLCYGNFHFCLWYSKTISTE